VGKVVIGGGYNGAAAASASFARPADALGGGQGWLVIAAAGSTFTTYAICATAG
jgi:hypothetical protein